MSSVFLRSGSYGTVLCLVVAGCSLDDRPLNYEYRALQAAGASGGGGSGVGASDAGAPNNGDAGNPAAGGDGGDPARGDAGSPSAVGGSANTAGTGESVTGANAGSAGASSSSAGTAGASASGAGSSGSGTAGAGPVFACGDLNHDLVDDCAQTLVQNSRFDTSIAHWDAESFMTETWVSVNATGAPGSGSISVNHTGHGSMMVAARQCILVTPNASYDVAARVQIGAGQIGTAGINVYFYDDAACQGNIILPGNTPIEGGIPGSWTEVVPKVGDGPLWIPGTAHSMYVRLFANTPPFPTTPLTVLIDDVLVAKRVTP